MLIQLILGSIGGEESTLGATLSNQTLVDVAGVTKNIVTGKQIGRAHV